MGGSTVKKIILSLLLTVGLFAFNFNMQGGDVGVTQQTAGRVVAERHDAGDVFTAFGLSFRLTTDNRHCPEVASADGATYTAIGRVLGIDSNGAHAGSSVITVSTSWKYLSKNWNFTQVGDRVEWTFWYNEHYYRFNFAVGSSYNNNIFMLEKIF